MYYALSLPTELSSQGLLLDRLTCDSIKAKQLAC